MVNAPQPALIRSIATRHHVDQGATWLAIASGGDNTAALSYAAFELRLAIERLTVQYWVLLVGDKRTMKDVRKIRSFKAMERSIYDLAGHQKQINGHFEFMRIVLRHWDAEVDLITPDIGALSRYWHECSELCHIGWTLVSSTPHDKSETIKTEALESLQEILAHLTMQVSGLTTWPTIEDGHFARLRDRFVAGEAADHEVKAFLESSGFWGRIQYEDGRPPQVFSKAVPQAVDKK